MDSLRIDGGVPLKGEISVSGAKNAALPLIAAGLVTNGTLQLRNVPDLVDTGSMEVLLRNHGMDVERTDDKLVIGGSATNFDAPYDLVRKMRASILVLGPLLARYGQARVSLPGGCAIGTRPVDLHIRAMQAFGAIVELADGYIQARAPGGLTAARVVFPMVSVGATENAMIAATLAKGTSELVNAAREPEISDLAECLIAMGARITGHGTDTITIEGVDSLGDATHDVIPDRIEAGTFAIAAAITGGELTLKNARARHLDSLFEVLRQCGIIVDEKDDCIRVAANDGIGSADITTDPFPGFPDRPAGAVHGADVPCRRVVADFRDGVREPLHACAGTDANGCRYSGRWRDCHGAGKAQPDAGAGDGHRPSGIGVARAGSIGDGRHLQGQPDLSSGPGLFRSRGQARPVWRTDAPGLRQL